MNRTPQKKIFTVCTGILSAILISGCALSSSISRLNTTPTHFLTYTPEATSTATFTATPTETATPTVTPTATATATATPCAEISGTVNTVSVASEALGVPMPVSIYLPPCYDIAGNYPVLYLLHGQGMDDTYWSSLGVIGIADLAISKGQTPFIMVSPFEERFLEDNSISKFPDAMINDLIPWVDANYATCTLKECRAIGGISRGGGWAIKLAMRYIDSFGTLGGHSYGLMFGDSNWVQKQLETHTVDDFPRIYLDRGEQDSLAPDIDYFVKVLLANGIRPEFHIYPGSHTRNYWQTHVQEYMNFYMDAWPEPIAQP
jgi:enterochelin esterase-like enzyme